eukprot:gene9798-20386_t
MMKLSFFTFNALLFGITSYKFQLLNPEVVNNQMFNQPLSISLIDYRIQNTIARLCLLKNGDRCHCFDESLILRENLTFPESCSYNESIRLSVMVYDSGESGMGRVSENSLYFNYGKDLRVNDEQITLILPLAIDDLSRCTLLLESLTMAREGTVSELLVIVPDRQYSPIRKALIGFQPDFPFLTSIINESALFTSVNKDQILKRSYPYALQMAIKLLVARVVRTDFYMTLDADLVLLRPWTSSDLLRGSAALYRHEGRMGVHPHWWTGSEEILQLRVQQPEQQGFGVTPALLNTHGALLTVARIREVHGSDSFEESWVFGFGRLLRMKKEEEGVVTGVSVSDSVTGEVVDTEDTYTDTGIDITASNVRRWSEYTLYRLVLDLHELFDTLHFPEHVADTDPSAPPFDTPVRAHTSSVRLHCHDIWFAAQLPWNASAARDPTCPCLFSVVQSSTGVSTGSLLSQWNSIPSS